MQPIVATQAPKYEYMPNDFMVFSLVTVILCGIFSPLSLVLSLPALYYSQQVSIVRGYIYKLNYYDDVSYPYTLQSKRNTLNGAINEAKKQGMIAAYLNIAAIVAALVVACLVMGLVLGLYGPVYARLQYCSNYNYYGSSSYYSSSYYYSSNYRRYCSG